MPDLHLAPARPAAPIPRNKWPGRYPRPLARATFAAGTSALVLLGIAAHWLPGYAATLDVPAAYPTIRAAVAAAASGDTVLLAPGVHEGGAYIDGKALTIASWFVVSGDTAQIAQTVLLGIAPDACGGDPGCNGNAVLEFGAAASGSGVVGLTLTGGENGITSGSTVDIRWCRVVGNGDGADFFPGSGGTFQNSLFADNSDDGIDLNGRMTMTIRDCEIRDNRDDGIEFRLHAYSGPERRIEIIGNRITGNGEDGVQLIDYPGEGNYFLRIERNLFRSNYDARGASAAIGLMPNTETIESLAGAPISERIHVFHNTFMEERNGIVGGANIVALNNLFTDITGTALLRVGGASIASYNLMWNCGTAVAESNVDAAHTWFLPPALGLDGELTATSPAIDAGTLSFDWQQVRVFDAAPGSYTGSAPDLGAFEHAGNTPPVVEAGQDLTIELVPDVAEVGDGETAGLRADVELAGSVSDDGLPHPPRPSMLWTAVSGPGPVAFRDPLQPRAIATFRVPGTYVLRLIAGDGVLAAEDQVTVTVVSPANRPPFVDAGPEKTVVLPSDLRLGGTVVDDGLPNPPGVLTTHWLAVLGPGAVTFADPSRPDTRASFTAPGDYVLRLFASDGERSVSDLTRVKVLLPADLVEVPLPQVGGDSVQGEPGWEDLRKPGNPSPSRAELALHVPNPQPASGRLRVELTLADGAPATLELLDITGRRLAVENVAATAPGPLTLEIRRRFAAGVYLVRLTQGAEVRAAKAVIVQP